MKLAVAAVSLSILGLSIATASSAAAEKTKPAARQGETTVDTVFIAVKRARPQVAATIARVPLETTLAKLKAPLVDRIEAAAAREPF